MEQKRNAEEYVRESLFSMQDLSYRDFQCRLMPTADPDTVIGVRTPGLRAFAKKLAGMPEAEVFLTRLPHRYYEENNVHACLIGMMKDFGETVSALDRFLPFVDNWATCDMISPGIFRKHLPELEEKIREWIRSGHTYTVRFAVGMLMRFYLGESFSAEYPALVSSVKSSEYYVQMMVAWYFATALAKQREAVMPYFEKQVLDARTHNKAIQKAIESRRISVQDKEYLRSLKVSRKAERIVRR